MPTCTDYPRKRANRLRRVITVLFAVLLAAGASAALQPTAPAQAATTQGQAIVNAAAAMLHKAYCFDGGSFTGPTHGKGDTPNRGIGDCGGSTTGFDCSGLALYAVYQGTGGAVKLPHSSSAQSTYGGQVISSASALQPGDLVFFSERSSSAVIHVGIYAGSSTVWDADDYGVSVRTHTLSWLESGPAPLRFVRGVRYWHGSASSTPPSSGGPSGTAPAASSTPPTSGSAPSSNGSPSPSGAGSSPSGPSAPATYAETSGSVVHTWTDYSNAGGTEGPDIPSNTAVQIACKTTGFAVADGNTWWYLVASSPWNSAYYASADAFYNNGATSGSLAGTPFDDPNVPDCPDSGNLGAATNPSPAPPTYAETPGSVVHTWTDYADAGGAQGPEIPSNSTVQIVCKVTGFAVADGDTWWYRIASSPWNSTYYGSADAFYNNGATSGSLIGTPFVDSNVPNC